MKIPLPTQSSKKAMAGRESSLVVRNNQNAINILLGTNKDQIQPRKTKYKETIADDHDSCTESLGHENMSMYFVPDTPHKPSKLKSISVIPPKFNLLSPSTNRSTPKPG